MNRDEVKALLKALAWDEIVGLAVADRRVVGLLLGLLYEADDYLHWLATEAIGQIGGAIAATNEEKVRELIRRLLWTLNDESGGTPWGAAGAVGAIAAARPDLFVGCLSLIAPYHDDENICPEFIWSVAMVGQRQPGAGNEYVPLLLADLNHPQAVIRGYAAWSLGALGITQAISSLAALVDDSAQTACYRGLGVYHQATVGSIAQESLSRLTQVARD